MAWPEQAHLALLAMFSMKGKITPRYWTNQVSQKMCSKSLKAVLTLVGANFLDLSQESMQLRKATHLSGKALVK